MNFLSTSIFNIFGTFAGFAVMAYREIPHWDDARCSAWGKYYAGNTDLQKKEPITLTP